MWAAGDSTAADDALVVQPTSGPAGRYKRLYGNPIRVEWFGAAGDGVADDAPAFRAALTAMPSGGLIQLGARTYLLNSTVTVTGKPAIFAGMGKGSIGAAPLGTVLKCRTGTATALVLDNADGAGFSDIIFDGGTLMGAGSYLLSITNGSYGTFCNRIRFANGVNGVFLQNLIFTRFQACEWVGFTGEACIKALGTGANATQGMNFFECSIGAGTANPNTCGVKFDGGVCSIDFVSCGFSFGGINFYMTNTTGDSNAVTSFIRVRGRGFENGLSDAIYDDCGARHIEIGPVYISTDGNGSGITQAAGGSDWKITSALIRGNGRSGIVLNGGYAAVTGCQLVNNASSTTTLTYTIAGVASDGVTGTRITTSATHAYRVGDLVNITAVIGTGGGDNINGYPRIITAVAATTFDIGAVPFVGVYTSGGTATYLGAGLVIGANATNVVATGNQCGYAGSGTNRQAYGIIDLGTTNVTEPNGVQGNTAGDVLRGALNAGTGISRLVHDNRLVNSGFAIAQRGSVALSVADDAYGPDRWNVLAQSNPIQFDRLDNPWNGARFACRLTQSNATAQRFGLEQIIEGRNCIDLRGRTVTWGGKFQTNAAAGQLVRFFIVEWTGTEDVVTSDIVLTWTSIVFTVNNFFINGPLVIHGPQAYTVSARNQPLDFSITTILGTTFTNLIPFVAIYNAQPQNTTLDFANQYLVEGNRTVFPFHPRPLADEQLRCDRYYQAAAAYVPATTAQNLRTLRMRAVPAITGGGTGFTSTGTTADSLIGFQTTGAVQTLTLNAEL